MAADMKDLSSLKISIIGLGLIGGSLARAFRTKAGILDITAVNRNPEAVSQALADGIIARGFAELDAQAMEHVCASDIIFICTPVQRTMQYLEFLSGKVGPSCLVTDVASTKGEIMAFVEKLPDAPLFIGGHPMAGSEKTGYRAGYAHMFENAYYVLTPAAGSQACVSADPSAVTVYADALNRLVSLVRATGAFPVVMNAGEHDFVTGGISHIPHIVASLLVNMTMSLDTPDGKMRLLAAGGFRDITRIASSSPEMWENIVMSNREYIDKLILKLENMLSAFRLNLGNNDSNWIRTFFETAKEYRDSLSAASKGLLMPEFDIFIDVEDKPGMIGELATQLGMNGINIRNVNVTNNRDMESGCIRITLPDYESAAKAADLLRSKGYKAYGLE